MKYIIRIIKQKENLISIKNGGKVISIEIHKEYNIYVQELIFGN